MTRPLALLPLLAFVIAPALALAQQPDSGAAGDSIFLRAQRLVAEGEGDSGRALVQAELDAAPVGSPRYAEVLYWRAVVAATAADAERDLRRIIIEYPLSVHGADALMRLAQLEMTRGENDQALEHLERMVLEHPESPDRARAMFWMARVLFEQGNAPRACARLADAVRLTPASQVELRNQIDYLNQRCVGVDTTAAPPPRSTAAPARATPAAASRSAAAHAAPQYTIQVAAYSTRAAAERLRARLAAQGYEARVVGSGQLFRVRVGRYDTRAAADSAAQQMRAKGMTVYVAAVEPER